MNPLRPVAQRISRCTRPLSIVLLLALGCAGRAEPGDPAIVSAQDSRFLYQGRLDLRDPSGPVLVWEDSGAAIDFEGTRLELVFGRSEGDNFLDVRVDQAGWVAQVPSAASSRFICPLPLAPGRHHLEIRKRQEASAGTLQFLGIGLADPSKAARPAAVPPGPRMEFYGDSITAGACTEDGESDQWDTHRTHNAELSYAALIGRAYHADWRNLSVSGIGIVTGWIPFVEGEVWDRLYPKPGSPVADLTQWIPDVVFVNLGDNDADYPKAQKLPFPTGFGNRYEDLIRKLRMAYPRAEIVLLLGGMESGTQSVPLGKEWSEAVSRLESSDGRMHHFKFTHWTSHHPRVADHAALAAELDAWLKHQEFMKPFPTDAR